MRLATTQDQTAKQGRSCTAQLTLLKLTPPEPSLRNTRENRLFQMILETGWLAKGAARSHALQSADSSDVVQESLTELVTRTRNGTCHTITKKYLTTQLAFRNQTFRRRSQRTQTNSEVVVDLFEGNDGSAISAAQLEDLATHASLNEQEKQYLRHRIQNRKYREIAKEMGVSISKIASLAKSTRSKFEKRDR